MNQQTNLLQKFYRKPHFSLTLPSRGKWYPTTAIDSKDGTVQIYAMTAADDTRFKSNEIFLNGDSVYDLIRSCVPVIKKPELIPTVDLDAILLSIRRASYGDTIDFKTVVPNTDLETTVSVNIEKLINSLPDASTTWDENLTISNENGGTLSVTLAPVNLKTLFSATRQIMKHQQKTMSQNDKKNAVEKLDDLDVQMKALGQISLGVLADGIVRLETDGYSTSRPDEIRQLLNNIDMAYYQVIKDHVDAQKALLSFPKWPVESTPEQKAAGAPETWMLPIEFDLNTFFVK